MATVFIRTNAGAAHDHAVMMGNAPSAGLAAIVCYDGLPVLDVTDIKALTAATAGHESYRIVEEMIPQTAIDPTSTLLEPELPEQLDAVQVNALGYLLTNGVLWGYVPYRQDKGGLTKTNDFAWVLKLVCTASDSPTLAVQYSSLDLREIRQRLLDELRAELNIPALAEMLQQAQQTCLIDGNDTTSWTLDGGEPDPQCQIIPVIATLPPIDGGNE